GDAAGAPAGGRDLRLRLCHRTAGPPPGQRLHAARDPGPCRGAGAAGERAHSLGALSPPTLRCEPKTFLSLRAEDTSRIFSAEDLPAWLKPIRWRALVATRRCTCAGPRPMAARCDRRWKPSFASASPTNTRRAFIISCP